jgi:signal transduction histidine kinase/CheY-like chemotaxis protein
LESYNISKKTLLILLSEVLSFFSYIYGFYQDTSNKEIYILYTTLSSCGLQLLNSSNLENSLIIFKIILVWYIGPILLGYQEIPRNPTPYMTVLFILPVFSSFFTYRKQLENNYLLAINTIKKMKSQLANIIQAMPDCVLILSQTQEVLLFNVACQELFKSADALAINQALKLVECRIQTEDTDEIKTSLYDDILGYLESDNNERVTFGINEINGKSYEWRGTKSMWDDTKIIILTTRDITSIILYERARAEAENKTMLLRTVSHEIRTPTNMIVNLSDSILEQYPCHELIDKIKAINISSKLLLNLINDLLDFSRMIANSFTITKSQFPLRPFLKEIHDLFSIQARSRCLDLRYFIDPLLPPTIITDPNRLRQIILNLLSNSMKFTLQGKIRLIALLTDDSRMVVIVSDSGIGISPSNMNKLFQAFNTVQDLKLNPQGCGLGLYISNQLAKMLGTGPIKVASKLYEGSKFWFDTDIGSTISLIDEVGIEEPNEMDIRDEREYESALRHFIKHESFAPIRASVVIADDNEFNLLVLRNFLANSEYVYEEAKSGLEVVEKVRKANADEYNIKVVILDFDMPIMTGPEASIQISKLYEEKKIAYIPNIIGYSADESQESIELGQRSGMKECIFKSCSKLALLNIIRKYISL